MPGPSFDELNQQFNQLQQVHQGHVGAPQSKMDAIWGTHSTTSVLPQAQAAPELPSNANGNSAMNFFFGNPLENAIKNKVNRDNPSQQPLAITNPVSEFGEFAQNVGTTVADAGAITLRNYGGFGKVAGIQPALNNAADKLQGFGKAIGGTDEVIPALEQGINKVQGGFGKIKEGFQTPLKPGEQVNPFALILSNTEGSNKVFGGVNDIVSGGMQAAFSPAAVLPHDVKQGMAAPFQAAHGVFHGAVKQMGVDPDSEMGKNLTDAFDNALQVGLVAYGAGKKGGTAVKAGAETGAEVGAETGANVSMLKSENPLGLDLKLSDKELSKQDFAKNLETMNARKAAPRGSSTAPGTPQDTFLRSQDFKNKLLLGGVDELSAKAASKLPPEHLNLLNESIKTGLNKAENKFDPSVPGVYDASANEIQNFMDQSNSKLKDVGSAFGDRKLNLSDTEGPDPTPIKKTVYGIMNRTGATLDQGMPNFEKSSIVDSPRVTKLVGDFYDQLKNNPSAKSLEIMTDRIEAATGELQKLGYKPKTPAMKALADMKTSINQALSEHDPQFGQLNQQYATLSKDIQTIKEATKVPIGGGKVIYRPQQLLERITGKSVGKYQEGIDAMQRIQSNFPELQAPKDLVTKAHIANLAEKYTGTSASSGLQSNIEAGVKNVVSGHLMGQVKSAVLERIPIIGKALEKGLEAIDINAHPEKLQFMENQARNFSSMIEEELLNKANKPEGIKMTPSEIKNIKVIIKELKVSDPTTKYGAIQKLNLILKSKGLIKPDSEK